MYVCNCVCIVMGPSHRRPHYVLHLVRLSVPFGHLSQTVDSQHFKEYIDQIICNDVYCADAIALARCQWEYILFVFVTCAELVAICTATQVQTVQTTSGTRRTGSWDAGEARATRHCWPEEEDCRRRRAFCAEGGTVQGIYVLICGYQEPPKFFISKMGRNFFTKLSGLVGVRIAHMAFTMEKTYCSKTCAAGVGTAATGRDGAKFSPVQASTSTFRDAETEDAGFIDLRRFEGPLVVAQHRNAAVFQTPPKELFLSTKGRNMQSKRAAELENQKCLSKCRILPKTLWKCAVMGNSVPKVVTGGQN